MIHRDVRYRAVVHYKYFDRSLRRVSKIYGVSKSSLQRWVHADPSVKRKMRPRHTVFDSVKACIKDCVQSNPFITMSELACLVAQRCHVTRSTATICRYRKQCKLTLKKAYRVVDGQHTVEQIAPFCQQHIASGDDLVCIDEAGFYVGDHGRRGYAPIGQRLNITATKALRRSKFTLILAISKLGVLHYEILDHGCRKADFVRFILGLPVAAGTTLLMDNLSLHKSKETVAAVKQKGCMQLFIPTYSPRFNAIENVFGTLKRSFRARCPPTPTSDPSMYKSLMMTILNALTHTDLSSYFDHATAHSKAVMETAAVDGTIVYPGHD